MSDGPSDLGATELVSRYRDGSLSPVDVTWAVLDRAARVDPAINAFAMLTTELATDQAAASEKRWRATSCSTPMT